GPGVSSKALKPSLIKATLATLHVYLSWVPLGYIFESTLVQTLLKIFPAPEFRNVFLQCLTEVGQLNVGQMYDQHFVQLFTIFITQLQTEYCIARQHEFCMGHSSSRQVEMLTAAMRQQQTLKDPIFVNIDGTEYIKVDAIHTTSTCPVPGGYDLLTP
ncbi:Exportin-1, partial [Cymbomonas tetramitiformis]